MATKFQSLVLELASTTTPFFTSLIQLLTFETGTLMTDRALQSVYLTRPSYSQRALAAITAILFTVLLVGVILSLYKQWQTVAEQGAVEPGALIAAGTDMAIGSGGNPEIFSSAKFLWLIHC